MKTVMYLLLACGLVLGLLNAAAGAAQAQNYAVVTIENPLLATMQYELKWGSEKSIHHTQQAGTTLSHYHALDGNNQAPPLIIDFGKKYKLDFSAAPYGDTGKRYYFGTAKTSPFDIDLFAK